MISSFLHATGDDWLKREKHGCWVVRVVEVMLDFQSFVMTEPEIQTASPFDEETRKALKWPLLVITNDVIGLTGTFLWVMATVFLDLPLVFFPFLTAAAMGCALRKASGGGVQKPLMIYCGAIAFLLGILGNIFTTILMASTGDETSTSLQDLFEFLVVHGEFLNVIQEAMTPMDLLIYSFIPLLAALLARGPLFGDEDEPPSAEQIPVGTAVPFEVEEPHEEDDLQIS